MLMHGLTDQLSATKENAQRVNSKCLPCCIMRGGSRGSALLHPATSFLEVCELPTPFLHSLGNVQWLQNKLTIGKNRQIPLLQNLHLCTHWEKNGSTVLNASGDCPLQTVEVFLLPGEAETSGSCWSLSFEVERRYCCWLHPKLLAPQAPGLPLVMRLLEANGGMLKYQAQSGSMESSHMAPDL